MALRCGTGQVRFLSFSHDSALLAGGVYTGRPIVWGLVHLRQNAKPHEARLVSQPNPGHPSELEPPAPRQQDLS
ncbi:MAG: hypothetical protein QGG36_01320 [Pirellulaceae bacterium]|nr:hypothetical protein [Pirellulaceae bacterium]